MPAISMQRRGEPFLWSMPPGETWAWLEPKLLRQHDESLPDDARTQWTLKSPGPHHCRLGRVTQRVRPPEARALFSAKGDRRQERRRNRSRTRKWRSSRAWRPRANFEGDYSRGLAFGRCAEWENRAWASTLAIAIRVKQARWSRDFAFTVADGLLILVARPPVPNPPRLVVSAGRLVAGA